MIASGSSKGAALPPGWCDPPDQGLDRPGRARHDRLSDKAALVGERKTLDTSYTREWSGHATVVVPVPDDHEHRFEIAEAGQLLEVFRPFRDGAGQAALLEVYMPVAIAEARSDGMALASPHPDRQGYDRI